LNAFELAIERLHGASRVAVLTGAGISAESGIPTFRDVQTGLWAQYNPEDLASPQAYAKDAKLVWDWYAWRFEMCANATPNAAHEKLAKLEQRTPEFLLVTQNVDGLHARAGSERMVELHGNIMQARCESCGSRFELTENFEIPPHCPNCNSRARPNVVWFGEQLPRRELERAQLAFQNCEVALVIGTSGVVEPAASLGRIAKNRGAYLIELNPLETPLSSFADASIRAGAVAGLTILGL
jgi:NAD-dependent deacetylase